MSIKFKQFFEQQNYYNDTLHPKFWTDDNFNEEVLNPGNDKILNTGKKHSAKNKSSKVDRIDLVVDFLKDKSMIKNYQEIFGNGDEWNN